MIEGKENLRLLIVDDTQKNIQLLGAILKKEGYQLNVAMNGLQALSQVKKVLPDLILLDVMMPELDGFETCKQLKASPDTKDIPVIFLTAKVEVEDIVRGFELGAIDYLTKPFNTTELLARVETHLELKKSREKLVEQADELRDWNVNLLSKIDDKTTEINEMNKILSRKNKVLESRDQIVEFILDVHDVNESKSFIVEKILELVDVHQIVIYSLPENNIFNAQFGMKQEENKVTNFSKSNLKDFPELPLLDTKNINKAILKGTSKENSINEYSLFLPLVKGNNHLGYIVVDNTNNKSPVPQEDIDIVADFASLVGVVLFDHTVTSTTELLDETIQDVLKDF